MMLHTKYQGVLGPVVSDKIISHFLYIKREPGGGGGGGGSFCHRAII